MVSMGSDEIPPTNHRARTSRIMRSHLLHAMHCSHPPLPPCRRPRSSNSILELPRATGRVAVNVGSLLRSMVSRRSDAYIPRPVLYPRLGMLSLLTRQYFDYIWNSRERGNACKLSWEAPARLRYAFPSAAEASIFRVESGSACQSNQLATVLQRAVRHPTSVIAHRTLRLTFWGSRRAPGAVGSIGRTDSGVSGGRRQVHYAGDREKPTLPEACEAPQ
ncbi:hypothetical protein DFH09DRAFT_1082523 [Mycena vulgaris]|nr:hypothetical protein DFH09DRAFT_1082523 [Mycena vulgaris]